MAKANSIPAHAAEQIAARLDDVACMLRAMRVIARDAETGDAYEAMGVAVEGPSERAHLIVDACIQKLGSAGLGNFDDNAWDAEEGATEGGAV